MNEKTFLSFLRSHLMLDHDEVKNRYAIDIDDILEDGEINNLRLREQFQILRFPLPIEFQTWQEAKVGLLERYCAANGYEFHSDQSPANLVYTSRSGTYRVTANYDDQNPLFSQLTVSIRAIKHRSKK